MPFGIARKPRLQLGQLLVGIDRGPGRGVDRHDRVHEIGVGDRPLERLVAAIGGTGDRDQMADAEMVEQGLLRGDDVADRDVRKIWAIASPVCGLMLPAFIEPKDEPSMLEATTNILSVSIALPGPIRPSHEPG